MSGPGDFRVVGGALRRALDTGEPVECAGRIDGEVVDTRVIADDDAVAATVVLSPAGSRVEVRGTVRARWEAPCRRCADPMQGELEVDVREVFESGATEGETYELGDDAIDLAPMVVDTVLVELPMAPAPPVVDGRCRSCGRTDEDLGLAGPDDDPEPEPEPVSDPRWAALSALELPDET